MKSFDQVVSQSDVIFIVGSGVSAAISQNSPTSTWVGLIRSGMKRARQLNSSLTPAWEEMVERLLNYGIENEDVDSLINAAGMVSTALHKLGQVAYSGWLSADIGSLEVKSNNIVRAIMSYPFPVLTTNYDTLIEQASGRGSRDWTDTLGIQEIVTRSSDAIGHIHGVWNQPQSVIFSASDYAKLLAHESTQALKRAMTTLKSIVYIGFGGGLDDPSFASLLEWHREIFPNSSIVHYRLCKTDESKKLQQEHANDHVIPIIYGDSHEDLPVFLASHAPKSGELVTNSLGLARDIFQEARESLLDSITSESVLADAGAIDLLGQDLVIPPILLPVPHATFVRERVRRGGGKDVERLNGIDEASSHDFFVIVGDEGSGLTTAVKWMAAQSSLVLGSAAPIFVRFTDCRIRRDPFNFAVVDAAIARGLIPDRSASLPPHVVAIDDVTATSSHVSEAVLAGIVNSEAIVKVVGCKQGDEDEVVSRLRLLGVAPRVLFLGRMRKADIMILARRISPLQGEQLANEVLDILDIEGLKRTPLTVSLLLYLRFRGTQAETRSFTNLLESYAVLLLGIGDPHADETELNETDLTAVLAKFAEHLIWDEKASVSEPEAVDIISKILSDFGWRASSSALLAYFLRRRILSRHGNMIEFARFAYFTLFAAKRALVDTEFRELILSDLFYYEPVATRLAAFSRADGVMLDRLRVLVDEEIANNVSPGSPYDPVMPITVDRMPPQLTTEVDTVDPDRSDSDDIEFPESDFAGGFGLVKEEMSESARLYRMLTLASNLLRDLDQVETLVLKQEILVNTLELWGRYITVLSNDPSMVHLRNAVIRDISESSDDVGDKGDDLEDFLSRSIPAGVATGGMEMSLSSPKLASTLDSALASGALSKTNEHVTAALLLLFLIRPQNWASNALSLVKQAQATWVLTDYFHALCQDAYIQGAMPENEVLALCKEVYLKKQQFSSPDIRSAHLNQYGQQLLNQRMKARSSRQNAQ